MAITPGCNRTKRDIPADSLRQVKVRLSHEDGDALTAYCIANKVSVQQLLENYVKQITTKDE